MDAKSTHDSIRKRLMNEPRGHPDMYGAILVQDTELVQSGKADIGVLFCHNGMTGCPIAKAKWGMNRLFFVSN